MLKPLGRRLVGSEIPISDLPREALIRIDEADNKALDDLQNDRARCLPPANALNPGEVGLGASKWMEYLRTFGIRRFNARATEYARYLPRVLVESDLLRKIAQDLKRCCDDHWLEWAVAYLERWLDDSRCESLWRDYERQLGRALDDEIERWEAETATRGSLNTTAQKTVESDLPKTEYLNADTIESITSNSPSKPEPSVQFGKPLVESSRNLHTPTNPSVPFVQLAGKHRQRMKDRALETLRKRVRGLRSEGLTYKVICDRLGDIARPGGARWRDLTWPVAYKQFTPAVTKWLSQACVDLPSHTI
jgi:hypothetical protein